MAAVIAHQQGVLVLSGGQRLFKIHAGLIAHAVQQPHQILGGGVAGGTGSEGAAAQTAQGGLYLGDAALDGGDGVDDAVVAGVVEVGAEGAVGIGGGQGLDGLTHLLGVGHADGVAQREVPDTIVTHLADQIHQAADGGDALKGAAEGGGNIHGQLQLRAVVQHVAQLGKGLLVGAVDVGFVVGLAEGDDHVHALDAGSQGGLRAVQVGDQRKQIQIRVLLHAGGGQLLGVGHLGDGLGADKGSALEVADAGAHHTVDEIQLGFRGNDILQILKAVTRADFIQFNFCHVTLLLTVQYVICCVGSEAIIAVRRPE